MAAHYFDSSAIIKRYVVETGTSWVCAVDAPGSGHRIYLAQITDVEVTAALARRRRGGSLSAAVAAGLLNQFTQDLHLAYRVINLTPAMLVHAASLADRHELRGYDAVQLAVALGLQVSRTALGLGAVVMVSADRELNAAAAASGLVVEDPNAYP